MANEKNGAAQYVETIRKSGLSIYDSVEIGDPALWIPTLELETLLDASLAGISLAGLSLRTRSKVVKEHVCQSLGLPCPAILPENATSFSRATVRYLRPEIEQP